MEGGIDTWRNLRSFLIALYRWSGIRALEFEAAELAEC